VDKNGLVERVNRTAATRRSKLGANTFSLDSNRLACSPSAVSGDDNPLEGGRPRAPLTAQSLIQALQRRLPGRRKRIGRMTVLDMRQASVFLSLSVLADFIEGPPPALGNSSRPRRYSSGSNTHRAHGRVNPGLFGPLLGGNPRGRGAGRSFNFPGELRSLSAGGRRANSGGQTVKPGSPSTSSTSTVAGSGAGGSIRNGLPHAEPRLSTSSIASGRAMRGR
jgi:hypothetical protein